MEAFHRPCEGRSPRQLRTQRPLQICHVQNLSICVPCDRGPTRRIRWCRHWCPALCSKHRGRRFASCRIWSTGRAPRLRWRCRPAPAAHAAPVHHRHRYSQVRQVCLLEEVCTQWHIATHLSRLLRILRPLRPRQLLDSSLSSRNRRKTQRCRSAQQALSFPSAAHATAAGLFWGVGPSARFGPERW